MSDSKLKFYIGNVTDGGVDGVPCDSVQCKFPLVWYPDTKTSPPLYSQNFIRVPIKFALRCDDGYKAINVKLTFDTGDFHIGLLETNYSDKSADIKDINLNTVSNVNKVVILTSDFYPDNKIKIYVSYTEVKI